MNAATETTETFAAPATAPRPVRPFYWSVRRELWENRALVIAPLVAAAIVPVALLLRAMQLGEDVQLLTAFNPERQREIVTGMVGGIGILITWVTAIAAFFYLLDALHGERKDRSVLFWKSMPLSDRDTVLSKVASATLVAPLIATLAAIATMIGFLLMISVVVMIHDGNPYTLIWAPGSPLVLSAQLIAAIPVYALWAMPTVGWLMLCSAWARSKPFLWALMIPVLAGVFVSMFDVMEWMNMDSGWFWKNIVGRMLLSVAPLTYLDVARIADTNFDGPGAVRALFSLKSTYSTLGTVELWTGVVAGVAMLFGATRLRRWRDEG